uniref:Carbonic anhydrase n=1 Tax=Chlorobium chlorochromatii (strain CaD3) TaxID=340177 RepID=Q3ARE2_CHLCH
MKKRASALLLALTLAASPLVAAEHGNATHSSHAATDSVEPAKALEMLLEGNRNFATKGKVHHLGTMATNARRNAIATKQKPFAVVVACSDSRVAPEILFDKGLGEIFVIRVAGNIVGSHELGSIEYAVEHLGAPLVMVLGHERCGAVTATYDAHVAGTKVEGNIGSLVQAIDPAVTTTLTRNASGKKAEVVEQCTLENVRNVATQIATTSPIIKEAIANGHVQVVKAYYDLDDGKVTVVK